MLGFNIYSYLFQVFDLSVFGVSVRLYMLASIVAIIYIFVKKISIDINNKGFFFIVLLFFIYMFSSTIWAENEITLAFVRAVGICLLLVSFFSLYCLSLKADSPTILKIEIFFKYYIYASLLFYLVGLYVYFSQGPSGEERGVLGLYAEGILFRMRGFANSPNNLVLMLMPIFFFSALLGTLKSRGFYLALLLCTILTISGAGYLILLCISFALICTQGKVKSVLFLVSSFISFCGGFVLYLNNEEFARIVDLRLIRFKTGSGRFDLFERSIEIANDSKYFGHGLGQARTFFHDINGEGVQSTHNSFLEVYLEGGGVGLVLFIACWALLAITLFRSKINFKSKGMLGAYLMCLFIISNINLMVYVELMVFNFFMFLFIMTVLSRKQSHRRL